MGTPAATRAGRRSSPATSCGRSTAGTARSGRAADGRSAGLSEGGYGARSTSGCITRRVSGCSRAGPATSAQTTCARSSGTVRRCCAGTARRRRWARGSDPSGQPRLHLGRHRHGRRDARVSERGVRIEAPSTALGIGHRFKVHRGWPRLGALAGAGRERAPCGLEAPRRAAPWLATAATRIAGPAALVPAAR